MKCNYACGSAEHVIARRSFLGGLAAGVGVTALNSSVLTTPAVARQLEASDRRVLLIFLEGGASQLETWDPKPGTDTGGPFREIPTSVPGVRISELLPHTAKIMHMLSLVRSINTKQHDHELGHYQMTRGRPKRAGIDYPHLGAVVNKAIMPEGEALPGYVRISPDAGRRRDSAYLGPKYDGMVVGSDRVPSYFVRPKSLTEEVERQRLLLKLRLDEQFLRARRTAATDAYTFSYDQAARLITKKDVFDTSTEAPAVQESYGTHDFGRHCLLARRLLENGVRFVKVNHANYDTHNENFNFHIEQLGEFDRSFATLVLDLAQRGLLDSTLVVVMSEFGRTPLINGYFGRDHWGTAWSIALSGCGIQPGAVIGKTNKNGTEVVDREVHEGHLFHTFLNAIGVDPTHHFIVGGRKVPIADPSSEAIGELLA